MISKIGIEVKRMLIRKPDNFKVIITSRKQIPSGFHQIELKGLDLRESKLLMNNLFKRYSMSKPEISIAQKEKLHKMTMGIPIVIKHCMAKLYEYNKPFETILGSLPQYSSDIVQFSFHEILQEVEKNDKEELQIQILLLLELMNRPLIIRQIADILGIDLLDVENRIPTLIDYQCLKRTNQDNQEKYVINEEIRLLTRSLAHAHGELVSELRQKITENFTIDKQMDYAAEERELIKTFDDYLTNKDYLDAERFIKEQLKKKPDSILLNYHYALYLKEYRKDILGAIEVLEKIRDFSGNHPNILKVLYSCYISLDVPNFDKAGVYVEQLEKYMKDSDDLKLEIAEFHVRWSTSVKLGRKVDPLEEILRQSMYKSFANKAIEILNTTQKRTPQIYYLFAQGYYNMWENQLAMNMINKAIESVTSGREEIPQPYFNFKKTVQRSLDTDHRRRRKVFY